jgi:hypothetical protein
MLVAFVARRFSVDPDGKCSANLQAQARDKLNE